MNLAFLLALLTATYPEFSYSKEFTEEEVCTPTEGNQFSFVEHKHDAEPPLYKYQKESNLHFHEHGSSPPLNPSPRVSASLLWLYAFCSTLIISVAPFLLLLVIPIENRKEHANFLKILLSFASGSLLGDAFLHLIPHALISHNHDSSLNHSHNHEHVEVHDISVGLWVLAGILTFLLVEKFVRIAKGPHAHAHSFKSETKTKSDKKNNPSISENVTPEFKALNNTGDIKVAGYLNLAADFTHNLTDGLAIGASFLLGSPVGVMTAVTVFLHEIPHEIGDFAILIQSGCSKRKLVTAIGALAGTAISLMANGLDERATVWILPFTAGGFIYIATVSVIPELLEDIHVWQSVKEVIAMLVGVYVMVLVTQYE